ncbi:MAG TPA: IclR family transcriptional regulator [Terriglobia bacterium]|nr:IclR family transcriptional regulator [Terriglobia bacterium]
MRTNAKTIPHTTGSSRALAKGLKILEHIARRGQPMPLREIASFCGLGKPSTLRLLRTLSSLGYIIQDDSERYSAAVFWPAAGAWAMLRTLQSVADEFLRPLHNEIGETVSLGYLFDDHIRVVKVLESPQHIRMSNFQGRILQPYASSLGKAITAFQSPEVIDRLLDAYGVYPLTSHTMVDQAMIRADFARVREQGYAEDNEETVPGGYCIGAPIRSGKQVVASVSVSAPKFRLSPPQLEALPKAVMRTASQISEELTTALGASSRET